MAEPFEVLGIPPAASLADARKAFKKLAQIYHPDRYTDVPQTVRAEAEAKMRELNAAFAELISRRRHGPDPQAVLASEQWLAEWWEASEQRRQEEELRRTKYRRWDEIEQARKAREEAERLSIASVWRSAYGEPEEEKKAGGPVPALPPASATSRFAERVRKANAAKITAVEPVVSNVKPLPTSKRPSRKAVEEPKTRQRARTAKRA